MTRNHTSSTNAARANGVPDALIAQLIEQAGGSPHAEFLEEMIHSALRLDPKPDQPRRHQNLERCPPGVDLRLPGFRPVPRHAESHDLRVGPDLGECARVSPSGSVARAMSAEGWMVITGAGEGIMKAGQGGAGRDQSFGVNIRLPFEQTANEIIQNDAKLITVLDLLASSKKLCPYLHIPLQSGDDQILQAMNRRHTIMSYIKLIEKALVTIPNLGIGTDLLVGFPGETETAFQNTLAVATDLPFSYLHVFPYSPRPGTAAMRLTQRLPPASVKKRTDILLNLDHAKRLAFHNKQIGKTISVLFEAGTRDSYRFGMTPNFTRVGVADSGSFQNQILPVRITAATDRCALGHVVPSQQANCAMVVR